MSNSIQKTEPGAIVRQGFGDSSIEKRGETASTMLAAQAQAEIQARYVMAMQRPRDMDNVRVRLLRECARPGFARRAYYSIPRRGAPPGRMTGSRGMVEGLSVRFAEAAIRLAGNILQATRTIYDDDFKRMVNVSATDLETNAVYSRDLILEKTVERSTLKEGAVVLGQRTNSAGEIVFIVQSTEEELLTKESALVSRMFRTEALRLIPADILEECERKIVETVRTENAQDPDAARKTLVDAFAMLNILPDQLKEYLSHDIATASPAEMVEMRGLFAAIRDGQVTWAAVMSERIGVSSVENGEGAKATTKAGSVTEKIRARAANIAVKMGPKLDPSLDVGADPAGLAGREREAGEEG